MVMMVGPACMQDVLVQGHGGAWKGHDEARKPLPSNVHHDHHAPEGTGLTGFLFFDTGLQIID